MMNLFKSYTAVSYTHLDVYKRQEERERILNLFENKGYKAVEKDFKRKLGLKYYGLLLRNYIYGR